MQCEDCGERFEAQICPKCGGVFCVNHIIDHNCDEDADLIDLDEI